MTTIACSFVRVVLLPALALACVAQEALPDKHAADIRAEQTQEAIFATPLCQQVNKVRHSIIDQRQTDPATLETDLSALMQKSEEVVLASMFFDNVQAVSPSGKQAIGYYDFSVLRVWKGSHKTGDLLTLALPWGAVRCGMDPPEHGPDDSGAVTLDKDWGRGTKHASMAGPFVLFLRRSQGDERQVTPGLRLAGGDGAQGLFALARELDRGCGRLLSSADTRCLEKLETSRESVGLLYGPDPLRAKYEGMPVPDFLKEVQRIANALGYGEKAASMH